MAYLRSLDDQIQIRIDEGQNLLVGRLPKCDVVIEDPSVSSQHARLQLRDGHLRVVDMGSTNGTRVNYSPLDGPGYLLDGDTIEFGNVSFIVDGPELSAPENNQMEELADLKPLESSQKLSDTMLNIPLPSQTEMDAVDAGVETDLAPVEEAPAEQAEAASEEIEINPPLYSFVAALVLLLLWGLWLTLHLLQAHPPPA